MLFDAVQSFVVNYNKSHLAPTAGFALALSGITSVYYEPDPEDIKDGGR